MLSNHFQPLVAELLRSFNEIFLYFFYDFCHLVGWFSNGFTFYVNLSSVCLSVRISPYSVRMQENTDQSNSKYRHFLRSVVVYKKEGYKNYNWFFPSHYVDLNNTNAKSGTFWATKRMFGRIMLLYYAWNTAVLSKLKAKR